MHALRSGILSGGIAAGFLCLGSGLPAVAAPPRPSGVVLVVSSGAARAYSEAVGGLRETLDAAAVPSILLAAEQLAQSGELARNPAAVVAVGSAAVDAVAASGYDRAFIATMILSRAAPGETRLATAIRLEPAAGQVLGRIRQLYPGRNRIGVIRGPALTAAGLGQIRAEAGRLGLALLVIDCPDAKTLLDKLPLLRDQADFVWCLPDNTLYRGPVVPALLLQAIRQRLPVIGFSEGMVRAGAMLGFYANYRQIGVQTAESVLKRLNGQTLESEQSPRTLQGAANERVARVLGIRLPERGNTGLAVLR